MTTRCCRRLLAISPDYGFEGPAIATDRVVLAPASVRRIPTLVDRRIVSRAWHVVRVHHVLVAELDSLFPLRERRAKNGRVGHHRTPLHEPVTESVGTCRHGVVEELVPLDTGKRIVVVAWQRWLVAVPRADGSGRATVHAHSASAARPNDATHGAEAPPERVHAWIFNGGQILLVHALGVISRRLQEQGRAPVERLDLGWIDL